jgi:alanyl-tRNA synthetase
MDKTAEKIVKELKEANFENRKLIKELAEKENAFGQTKTVETEVEEDGIAIVKRDFGEVIDANRMVQTAAEMIKRNEATVALFYGHDGKTCKLMVMAGETAVKKGVNAKQLVKEVAPIFGGGGGGRTNFAQSGGTKPDKLLEALRVAEESLKRQLKQH